MLGQGSCTEPRLPTSMPSSQVEGSSILLSQWTWLQGPEGTLALWVCPGDTTSKFPKME